MIVLYEAFANIGSKRLQGDVVKENTKTVFMIFNPPEEMKKKILEQTGMLIVPTKAVKRHKKKHNVSRFV